MRSNNFSTQYLKDLLVIVTKLVMEGDWVSYNLILNRVDQDENYYGEKNICDIDTLNYARIIYGR